MIKERMGGQNAGYVFAIGSAALFGSISTLAKPAVDSVNPILLAAMASFVAAIFFTPFTIRKKIRFSKKEIVLMLALAVLGAALAPSLYFVGLKTTTASDATILANSEIMFTVLIAILIFKERLNRIGYISAALVMAGVVLITTQFDPTRLAVDVRNFGNILVILTMLCWALDNNLSKIATATIDLWRLVQIKSAIGAALLAAVIAVIGIPVQMESSVVPNVVLLGIVGLAVPLLLFYMALKKIGTVRTILIFSTSSIFGVIYATVFLGEQIRYEQILALGIMIFGLLLLRKT